MNADGQYLRRLDPVAESDFAAEAAEVAETLDSRAPPPIPDYLEETYWWAYGRSWAVRIFERNWLVDLILWGQYARLRDEAFQALGKNLPGQTLQIACCYSDLTPLLQKRVAACNGQLTVIDVLPVQIENLRNKLERSQRKGCDARARGPKTESAPQTHLEALPTPPHLLLRDSTDLRFPEASFDRTLLFFLMHEQPATARRQTLKEALRVTKPGGTVVIVDFHKPKWWQPLRYLWLPVLSVMEPFAPDLWRQELATWLPPATKFQRETYFGAMYQRLIIKKEP